jgi:uncharacterized OB-fold protein
VAGVAAAACYVPRFSITAKEYERAVGSFAAPGILEKAIPGFDEDEVTMAVAAGSRGLAAARTARAGLLAIGSSAKSFETKVLAIALGLEGAEVLESLGTADGLRLVRSALAHTDETGVPSLVVVSDAPREDPATKDEHPLGAAAAAIVITAKGGVTPGGAARKAPKDDVIPRVGYAGAASAFLPFLASVHAAKKGDRVVLATGGGALSFTVAAKPKGDLDLAPALDARTPVTYEQALALRRYRPPPPGTEYSQGAYVSPATYAGEAKARYRLVGEVCAKCGRLHFPPRESCLACGARAWKEKPLKPTGKVYAYTVIGKGAAPSEFLEQQLATGDYATGIVALDDGPRVSAMLADVDPAKVRIGMHVRMVFRRLYAQEGVTRYGFKFGPA